MCISSCCMGTSRWMRWTIWNRSECGEASSDERASLFYAGSEPEDFYRLQRVRPPGAYRFF